MAWAKEDAFSRKPSELANLAIIHLVFQRAVRTKD